MDYAAIPTMVEQSIQIFNLILKKSIDEEVLKAIATTFQDNINMMKEKTSRGNTNTPARQRIANTSHKIQN
jgi:hypothetical protein